MGDFRVYAQKGSKLVEIKFTHNALEAFEAILAYKDQLHFVVVREVGFYLVSREGSILTIENAQYRMKDGILQQKQKGNDWWLEVES